MFFREALKVYTYNSILGNVNAYFLEHTIPRPSLNLYFKNLDKSLDTYCNEKILLVGDFNVQTTDHYFSSFLYQDELLCIVKKTYVF